MSATDVKGPHLGCVVYGPRVWTVMDQDGELIVSLRVS